MKLCAVEAGPSSCTYHRILQPCGMCCNLIDSQASESSAVCDPATGVMMDISRFTVSSLLGYQCDVIRATYSAGDWLTVGAWNHDLLAVLTKHDAVDIQV